jgi:hypothetical protein
LRLPWRPSVTAKWSAARVTQDHWRTLVDARTNRIRVLDILAFYGTAIILGLAAYFTDFQLRGLEGVLSGVSIYTALLFGLLVHVFQLRVRLVDQKFSHSSVVARLTDELEANVSYTVLMGLLTTASLIGTVATTQKDMPASKPLSAIICTLLIHLFMSLLLVLKRTRAAYRNLTALPSS